MLPISLPQTYPGFWQFVTADCVVVSVENSVGTQRRRRHCLMQDKQCGIDQRDLWIVAYLSIGEHRSSVENKINRVE